MIFRLLLFPIVLLVRLLLSPLRALRRARAAPKGALIEIVLRGVIREGPARPRRFWPPRLLVAQGPRAELRLQVLRRVIDEIIADPRVAGAVVTIDGIEAGWATLEAIRAELLRVRSANKRLCAWLPSSMGNREIFLATAAEIIVAAPSIDVALVGTKSEVHFAKGALDRLGIDADLHARKEFKSAADRFVRETRTDGDRLQTQAIIDAIDGALIGAIAEGRALSVEQVRALVDLGPTHARAAVERKLVDHVCHDDDLPTVLGARLVNGPNWYRARRVGKDRRPLFAKPYIGVVEVHGAIGSTSSPVSGLMGQVASADRVIADLRSAERNPRVAAVILDVDSPGGTIVASDAIGAAVRRLAAKKPVIARMGDVAASGGYWIACEARAIVARPLTLTGSIGVVAVRPIAARLLERIGIVRDVIANGRYADFDAIGRPPREDERALLAREIDAHYQAFVDHVARARKKTPEQIEEVARGRVFVGREAASRALVDHLGGFDVALALARAAVPHALDDEPHLVTGPFPSHRESAGETKRVLGALLELLPHSLRAELAPYALALEHGVRVAAVVAPDRIR